MTKERPILFSAPMVRAILEGRKTQTRRAVKLRGNDGVQASHEPWRHLQADSMTGNQAGRHRNGMHLWQHRTNIARIIEERCPYGQPGDRLWVRETWSTHACFDCLPPAQLTARSIHYWADGKVETGKGRPSIHMPRWVSRILLEVAAVRVERLQEISEADAQAEGACRFTDLPMGTPSAHPNRWSMEEPTDTDQCLSTARYAFANLFSKVNGKGRGGTIDFSPWDANPFVWVIEFRRIA